MAEIPPVVTCENVTDEIISKLILMPKKIQSKRKAKPTTKKSEFSLYRYPLLSHDGIHEFVFLISVHNTIPNKFSVILNYGTKEIKGGVNVFRCNSPHGWGNPKKDPLHFKNHMHTLLAADWKSSVTQHLREKEEAGYQSLKEAITFFVDHCKIDDDFHVLEDWIAAREESQISLFELVGENDDE